MLNKNKVTLCFALTVAIGFGFLFLSLTLIPILPLFQLDAVLTQEQLRDKELRESTLKMLQKASGNQWILWAIAGLAQITIGVSGLFLSKDRSTMSTGGQ